VANPSPTFLGRCSPDWIQGGLIADVGNCPANDNFYVRSASKQESLVVGLKDSYTLVKGETCRFSIRYRSPLGWTQGSGSFQLVFSTENEGLQVQSNKKWVALDFYDNQSCDWKNVEGYFTVPTDNNKKYDEMKYLVLQYNHEYNEYGGEPNGGGTASLIWHFDDVSLRVANKCEDIKYIQDWQYHNDKKIEQANYKIYAGSYVSPYSWPEIGPVIVKNSSKIIYRAPTIFLEPGFSVEPGAYFETQMGTCVEDPCPPLPSIAMENKLYCSVPQKLGNNLPEVPGVFYSWSPANYFSNPNSRVTDFSPLSTSQTSCLNATLNVSTICGATQQIPFSIRYYKAAPQINTNNLSVSTNGITGNIIFTNTNSYTITVTTLTGQVLNTISNVIGCGNTNGIVPFNYNYCNSDMCQRLIINITAENGCFPDVSKTVNWTPPTVNNTPIVVSNLIQNDFEFSFDYQVPSHYEYFTVAIYNASGTSLICSNSYSACNNPFSGNSFHFDAKDCLGCVSQCESYKVIITQKQYCGPVLSNTINWTKNNNVNIQLAALPNVITPDGDGVNDELCFDVIGADWYHIVIVNRWQNVIFEDSGCVNQTPFCIPWAPLQNGETVTYTYIIEFKNQCRQKITNHSFLQVFPGFGKPSVERPSSNIVAGDITNECLNDECTLISPNPFIDELVIQFDIPIERKIELIDSKGSIIKTQNSDRLINKIDTEKLSAGVYYIHITGTNESLFRKVQKL
jgi:hypothetical protein